MPGVSTCKLQAREKREGIMLKDKCVCMTTIICHAIETAAICAVIAILGFKALEVLDNYTKISLVAQQHSTNTMK